MHSHSEDWTSCQSQWTSVELDCLWLRISKWWIVGKCSVPFISPVWNPAHDFPSTFLAAAQASCRLPGSPCRWPGVCATCQSLCSAFSRSRFGRACALRWGTTKAVQHWIKIRLRDEILNAIKIEKKNKRYLNQKALNYLVSFILKANMMMK